MICNICGKENEEQAKVCVDCGGDLEGNVNVSQNTEQLDSDQDIENNVTEEKKPQKSMIRKPSAKSKKKLIIKLVAAVIIVVALYFGYSYLNSITNPGAVAKACYTDMANGNFAGAYNKFYITEDQFFMSKDDFIDHWKSTGKLNISDINVKKITSSGKDKKTVTVSYFNKDTKKEETQDVPMIKAEGKKFLFFDKWLLNSSGQ